MKANYNKRQEKLMMVATICYAIVSGVKMVTLYEAFQEKDKVKITSSSIMLLFFLTSFICFLAVLKQTSKKQHS